MVFTLRPVTDDEIVAAFNAKATALLQPLIDDERVGDIRPGWTEAQAIAAWDGDTCVGTAGQFDVDTAVPGGARLPTAAVTRVGVLPTHRRQGIATALIEGLVADAFDRSLAMMSLRAAETMIYGRFGFGLAGEYASITLDPLRARPVRGAGDGSCHLVPPTQMLATVDELYPRVALRRPGAITRPSWVNRMYLKDAIALSSANHVVVHRDAHGVADGFAHYGVKWTGDSPVGDIGVGTIYDVFGATDAAELALWEYLTNIDLVDSWTAAERPVDDLVRNACADPRAYRVTHVEDEQWVRLVDVDAALRARSYRPVPDTVTIAVEDPLIGTNTGIWTISASGSERVRDTAAPGDGHSRADTNVDISAPVSALSAAYLGGRRWADLASLGQVNVHNSDATERADALFLSDRAPFCGTFF